MSVQDAYAPPRSTVRDVSGGTGLMTDSIVTSLRKTRPWVLLVSIIGFVFTALMVLSSVGMIFSGNMLQEQGAGIPGGAGGVYALSGFYLVAAIIYFMSSRYLSRYAGAIKRAVTSMGVADLEIALSQQASFWKLVGILTLISLLVLIAMIVFAIVGGAMFMGAQS